MKTEIRRFDCANEDVFHEILLLLREGYEDNVSRFFIYHDDHYPAYLRKISADHQNFWIYYAVNSENEDFIGFVMFRTSGKDLFLNQLFLKPAYQFKGLGTYLLYVVLGMLEQAYGKKHFDYLKLDAFANNTHARKVYYHLGMRSTASLNWYRLTKASLSTYSNGTLVTNKKPNYLIELDQNGFSQLVNEQFFIGTVINDVRAKINGEATHEIDQVIHFLLQNTKVSDVCITSKEHILLPLMDRSLLYSIKFEEALNWKQK